MPAIEIWGPATWTLFHTLIEHLREDAFTSVGPQLYNQFVKICKLLPCPECADDATQFLARNPYSNIKSKTDLKNLFYLFHNWVNAKKRKPLFNYSNVSNYGKYNIVVVINRFISVYHTKGNMKMLNESFQRQLTLNSFRGWISSVLSAFMPAPKPVEEVKPATIVVTEVSVVVEEVKPATIVEAEVSVAVVEEEPATIVVVEEPIVVEEPATIVVVEEPIVEEPAAEESATIIEELAIEEPATIVVVEEPVIEEQNIVEEEPVKKGKKGKKGKK